jgi:hypothetical protein
MVASTPLAAQGRALRVITPDNVAVPYAVVTLGTGQPQVADSGGFLALGKLTNTTVPVEIRRIGHTPFTGQVALSDTAAVTYVRLTPIPALADRIAASAGSGPLSIEGFYQRLLARQAGKGNGIYFTPEEIERRNVPDLAQLVRSVSGLRLERASDGGFVAIGSGSAACQIGLALDGVLIRSPGATTRGTPPPSGASPAPNDSASYMPMKDRNAPPASSEATTGRRAIVYADSNSTKVDHVVSIGAVMAVEVYPRAAAIPAALSAFDTNCGLIVIWTGIRL